jgi:hypothetical protein
MTDVAKTAAQWAEEINAAYGRVVGSYLELGRILNAAKDALDQHGAWESTVAAHLPFDITTAQRLMKIARDERIAKAARGQLLPDSWRIAYELTMLPSPAFETAVTAGDIHPRMTRAHAITLVREAVPPKEKRKKKPKEPSNAAEADMIKQWANSFSVHARDNIGLSAQWTKRFGKLWKKCPKTQEMRKTARKCADEWDSILKVIDESLADPNAEADSKPKTGAERTRAYRQRQKAKEAEGEKTEDGAQIDLEECIAKAKAAEQAAQES